jgi:mono/diheme cytochrome c family protein
MHTRPLVGLLAVTALVVASPRLPGAAGGQAPRAPSASASRGATAARSVVGSAAYRPVLDRYCVTCHNSRLKTAGLSLDAMDLARVPENADVWEKVIRKLRTSVMPPAGAAKPDPAVRAGMVTWLETTLDQAAAAAPYPGHPSIHRLNRVEYANAIRDLLGLDVDAAAMLPPDDPAYGFDNIGEVLTLSSALLERYAGAAAEIATLATGDASDVVQRAQVYRAPADLSQDKHNEGLPLGTTGGLVARPTLPLDGEYVLKASLFKTNLGLIKGLEFPRDVEFLVDGEHVFGATIGGEQDFEGMLQNQAAYADEVDSRLQVRLKLKAGPHEIGVTFLPRAAVVNSRRLQAMVRTTSDTSETLLGPPHIMTVSVAGPFSPTGPGDTPSRRRIFICQPAEADNGDACARTIVTRLAHRAYRGTDTPADVRELLTFYREGRRDGSFETGIAAAIQRALSGPKFLVRIERDPSGPAGTIARVSSTELASRLSFFLWSSIPDDELLRVAGTGALQTPAVLEQQVRRMLADPKGQALVSNFAGQWLQLRNLRSAFPDSREFPNFDDQLRQGFRRETELFFDSIIREDRNVLDLLTADYTFLNERLAKHYGVPNVYGDHFRRVAVTDEARKGLLGQGSILTVTSHADRTSPVVRGKWILDTLLGAAPPPPPPNVPPLKEKKDLARPMSMRQRMEEHRANPVCASCHRVMDPLGFALENFDAVGAWRSRDGRVPIDTSGTFIDGSSVSGPVELRQAVLRQPENFVTTLTEKLLVYALGRGIDHRDMPAVRGIVKQAARTNYRMSSIVLGIVKSDAFQKRVKVADATVALTAQR